MTRAREDGEGSGALLREGTNCWRRVHTGRLSFLVDADVYFRSVAEAFERAERQILILGWDIHSELALNPGAPDPKRLGPLLSQLVERRPDLDVYVLDWDFAVLLLLERELLPLYQLGWKTHRRVYFHMDADHPTAAAHHQKIVVVDDRVAFTGGMDLAAYRWDTPDHAASDPRRVTPGGRAYGPFHDVQVAVDGEAAAALGELARERWLRATGERLPAPRSTGGDPWPVGLAPDARDLEVALARTDPAWRGRPEVREVEALFKDSIDAARAWIYIENQYLTSASLRDALAARLSEEQGPEVVIITPRECPGWLEEATMGALRGRFLDTLREADRHDRLRVLYPVVEGESGPAGASDDVAVNVHAKVMVVDDELVRVGSANLSNRSMGFDTELDLAFVAEGRPKLRRVIRRFRDGLLADHLGASRALVARTLAEHRSLTRTVDVLRRPQGRTLLDLEVTAPDWLKHVPDAALLDPERPIGSDELVARFLPQDTGHAARHPIARAVLVLSVLLAAAAAWRWTPLSEYVDPRSVLEWARPLRENLWGPFLGLGVFVVSSLLLVPVTLLILISAALFGPWVGFACAIVGALLSSSAAYGLGRVLWRDFVRGISGPRLNELSRKMSEKGILSVAAVRLVPVAPFTVVNLVAGASEIRYRDFFLGTLIPMAPGALAMSIFADRILYAASDPGIGSVSVAVGILLALILAGSILRKKLSSSRIGPPAPGDRGAPDEPARKDAPDHGRARGEPLGEATRIMGPHPASSGTSSSP